MKLPRFAVVANVAGVIVLAAAAGGGAYAGTHRLRLDNPPVTAQGVPAPLAAVAGATTSPVATPSAPAGPEASPAAVSAALTAAATDPALGPQLLAEVTDPATGAVLFDRDGSVPAAPASTAKLAMAVATLTLHRPTDRITTTVRSGANSGTVVLVGAGDPTLSAAPAGTLTLYRDAARISDLAAQLKARGMHPSRIVVDTTLFTGPAVSPGWLPGDVPSSYASAITSLMVDGGRDTPGAVVRSATPQTAAGDALAADLGLPPSAVVAGVAPPGSAVLASVTSATYGELVDQSVVDSDNVLAEVLGRDDALAAAQPASFTGAAAAIRSAVAGLGVELGTGMLDASGLAGADRLSPQSMVGLLALIAGQWHPALRDIVADLPVGGWSGTLADRFLAGSATGAGAGVVRAKTGTLTGVSTLAGLVTDGSGRVLAFSFAADQIGPTDSDTADAEQALDALAAALAACTCR